MKTDWGHVAAWYDKVVNDPDSYQVKVVLPRLLALLGDVKGETVLDIACGQGFFSKALADQGAVILGADAGEELVAFAKELVPGGTFRVAESHRLLFIKDASIDAVIIVLALQNIKKMEETLAECARVLKPGGELLIVLNHPAFRTPKGSSWGFDEKADIQYRRIDRYGTDFQVHIDMHPGEAKKVLTTSFHRPIEAYFKAFQKAGLIVSDLEEWYSHKKSEAGPRQKAEDTARKEIPLFLAIKLKRV